MITETIKIHSIKKIQSRSKRYDIQTEKYHNFFANNILVHNSLGICFWHNNQWHVSTRGSMSSDQAKWATAWLRKNAFLDYLTEGYTYLVEIIYTENRIVISYDFEGLVLLGGYDPVGQEICPLELKFWAATAGLRIAATRTFKSVEDILTVAKELSYNEEGFVICFQSGFRLKIKGDSYCRLHRIVSNITPLCIWEMMMNCDDLNEIWQELPEEFQRDYDKIRDVLEKVFEKRLQMLQDAVNSTNALSDAELGKELRSERLGLLPEVRRFIFPSRKKNFLETVKTPGRDRTRFFNTFRPTGNKLEGYVPSTLMTRFDSETE